MLYQKLSTYHQSGQWIAVFKWAEGNRLVVGSVVNVTPEMGTFDLVDTLGQPDEKIDIPLSQIRRIEESFPYMERLRLFRQFVPPMGDVKGQTTCSAIAIAKRLRDAVVSGECVSAWLPDTLRQDYRVLGIDREFCELEEFGDAPLRPVNRALIRLTQIEKLRWRSSGELAVTKLWSEPSLGRRHAQGEIF